VSSRSQALARLEAGFDRALDELCGLTRIPGVSAAGFDPVQVERSAEAVADLLGSSGLSRVELLRVPGSHPYVVGEWLGAGANAPTALIYAHHDVQPPGRLDHWSGDPFEPVQRGGRLFGRGVVDDKAGLMVHLAALRAWLECGGAPLNLKLVVEGEEEIGSPHLAEFLQAQRERLRADVIVLSDTANLDTGLPSLTTSLRGLVVVDVAVRALDHPLHSGMWGGPVSDTTVCMVRLLARLVDDRGVLRVPGLAGDVPRLDAEQRSRLEALPFDESTFRRQAGVVAKGPLSGEPDCGIWERLWWRPSLAFTALEGASLAGAANQLMDVARARIGLRLAPGQDPQRAARLLAEFLHTDPPAGARVEVELQSASGGWSTRASGPAFDAARRALSLGYGREAVDIGCGGSIPFVQPFCEVLDGAPALLLGLEDPLCNAHGENESLDLADFRRASRAALHLQAELAAADLTRSR